MVGSVGDVFGPVLMDVDKEMESPLHHDWAEDYSMEIDAGGADIVQGKSMDPGSCLCRL